MSPQVEVDEQIVSSYLQYGSKVSSSLLYSFVR